MNNSSIFLEGLLLREDIRLQQSENTVSNMLRESYCLVLQEQEKL